MSYNQHNDVDFQPCPFVATNFCPPITYVYRIWCYLHNRCYIRQHRILHFARKDTKYEANGSDVRPGVKRCGGGEGGIKASRGGSKRKVE